MEEDEWIISDQSAREASASMAVCVRCMDKVWRWKTRYQKEGHAFDTERNQRIYICGSSALGLSSLDQDLDRALVMFIKPRSKGARIALQEKITLDNLTVA